jgi:hypothetical protein
MTSFPTQQPDQGATNPPNSGATTSASGNHGSGELRAEVDQRAELVALITARYPLGRVWPTECHAEQITDAIVAAGFRRVSEDDTTVERVAAGLAHADELRWAVREGGRWRDVGKPEWPLASRSSYLARARAAVRALREDTP